RDGVSKAKPKYEKPGAETTQNAVFDLAMPRRSIQGEAKVLKQLQQRSRLRPKKGRSQGEIY
ncbi:hypothetical protein, partial [uncultured Alistipes sp.]|uniref:hypothetical protein n=1 Tax=uncultured Alistipes sp. TaxID=538949 RepID=UPI0026026459